MELVPEDLPDPGQGCGHTSVMHLGTDGLADFYRCRICRPVVVHQGRRTWTIRGPALP